MLGFTRFFNGFFDVLWSVWALSEWAHKSLVLKGIVLACVSKFRAKSLNPL